MNERVPAPGGEIVPDGSVESESGTWDATLDSEFDGNPVAHALASGPEGPGEPSADMPAGVTIGRYQLRDELGRGGMGVVYRAYDPKLGREVALKVVRSGHGANEAQARRFSREARAVARLKHPNIVEVYDMGGYDGGVYYTMQYVAGTSLARRIGGEPIEPREAALLAIGIARALSSAHAAGLIHRDVKPGNVLLDGDTPKLTDFGLVKQLDSNEATAVLTRGGQILGTPAYMAPEQLAGDSDAVVPATDQYALGIILFEMLSGQRPFKGVGSSELVQRMTVAEPPRLSLAGVPRELDLIRRRAMAFATDERYPSCAEMADDLQRFLDGAPVRASAPGMLRRARWLWRRYWRRAAVAAAVLAAVFGGVQLRAAWSDWQRERAQERLENKAENRRKAMEARALELLANDDPNAADAVFQTFATFEGNRDTRALARAWLHRGQRLRAQGRDELGLDTLAAAYAGTDDHEVQGAALIEMAEAFREQYRWPQLAVLLDTMSKRTPRELAAPRMNRARLDSALAQRDIDQATALAARLDAVEDAHLVPLLEHLAQATATDHRAQLGQLWDMDGDGQPELVLFTFNETDYTIVGLDSSSLPVRQRMALPAGLSLTQLMYPLPGAARPTLLIQSKPRWVLASPAPHGSGAGSGAGPGNGSVEQTLFGPARKFIEVLVSADVDGDGQLEHHASVSMALAQLLQGPDGNWSLVAHDDANAVPARVTAMVASDLDGDGQTELVVGSRGWHRYDLRIFRPGPDGERAAPGATPLDMIFRRQFGSAISAVVLDTPEERLLAVLQGHDPDEPLNHRVFPAGSPQGQARGIHFLAFVDGQLQPRGLLPLPLIGDGSEHTPEDQWDRLGGVQFLAADIDGDGRDELILAAERYGTFIYRQAPGGHYRELALVGVELLTLAQLDDDPMPELVVNLPDRDRRVWVLGTGSAHLPVRTAQARGDRANIAQDHDPRGPIARRELSARWQRAEDLHAIGLGRAAVDQLREVATLAVETVDEARALYRAGQMLVEDGELAEAGALFVQAASCETAPCEAVEARAWEAAADAYLADMRWREAAYALDERLDLSAPPASVRTSAELLRARREAHTTRFDFRDGLDTAWRVIAPLQVRMDHEGGGLRITGGRNKGKAGHKPLVVLPMTRTGEPLRVTVEFELERLDWASYFHFFLVDHDSGRDSGRDSRRGSQLDGRPADRYPVDGVAENDVRVRGLLSLHYRGGGGLYELQVGCRGGKSQVITDLDGLLGRPLRLEWQQAQDGRTSCELSTGGVADRRIVVPADDPLPLHGPMALRVEQTGGGAPASAQTVLLSVELTGFAPDTDAPRTGMQQVHHQLTLGRPDAALPMLRALAADDPGVRADPAWQLARAVVAEALGDPATTRDMLRSAMTADISLGGNLTSMFRHNLDRFEEPLRAILGDRYYLLFADATLATVYAHQDEGRMFDLLRDHLDGLEDLPLYLALPAGDDEDRDAAAVTRIDLQVWRARAWRQAGRVTLAMRTLRAAEGLVQQIGERGGDKLQRQLQRRLDEIRYVVRSELAACYLARGERDRAMDALFAAIMGTHAPELAANKIVAPGTFRALRTHPRWPEIDRLRGLWP